MAQRGAVADDFLEVVLGADLFFEVGFLFAYALGTLRELAMLERVLHTDCDLLRDLPEKIQISLGEGRLNAAAQSKTPTTLDFCR